MSVSEFLIIFVTKFIYTHQCSSYIMDFGLPEPWKILRDAKIAIHVKLKKKCFEMEHKKEEKHNHVKKLRETYKFPSHSSYWGSFFIWKERERTSKTWWHICIKTPIWTLKHLSRLMHCMNNKTPTFQLRQQSYGVCMSSFSYK